MTPDTSYDHIHIKIEEAKLKRAEAELALAKVRLEGRNVFLKHLFHDDFIIPFFLTMCVFFGASFGCFGCYQHTQVERQWADKGYRYSVRGVTPVVPIVVEGK